MKHLDIEPEHLQEFRNVFSSHEGQQVLKTILLSTLFFGQATNDEERGLKNWSSWLVSVLAGGDPYPHVEDFIRFLNRETIEKEKVGWFKRLFKKKTSPH